MELPTQIFLNELQAQKLNEILPPDFRAIPAPEMASSNRHEVSTGTFSKRVSKLMRKKAVQKEGEGSIRTQIGVQREGALGASAGTTGSEGTPYSAESSLAKTRGPVTLSLQAKAAKKVAGNVREELIGIVESLKTSEITQDKQLKESLLLTTKEMSERIHKGELRSLIRFGISLNQSLCTMKLKSEDGSELEKMLEESNKKVEAMIGDSQYEIGQEDSNKLIDLLRKFK